MKFSKQLIFIILLLGTITTLVYLAMYKDGEIRLIIRGDDMGFSHAVNLACIKAYQEGILTSVEVMVPCQNFPEAVQMLRENPDLDVGIHLTLNSEWENIKWGPLTETPSLVDENGYFFPMTWPDDAYGHDKALASADWKLNEIEQELRAQIETALSVIPNISHATPHMAFHAISSDVAELVFSLVREYGIDANLRILPMRSLPLFGAASTLEDMISNSVMILENLEPGTWEFSDHPGMLLEGVENHWHVGAEDDAAYRDLVTKVLTSAELKEVIERRGIKLIGYNDLKFWH
jgi:predicted glycoside hydrolase/deacetylase ChbG (UPF0249 family)